MSFLSFNSHTHFKQRIVCSIFSGKSIVISNIRPDDENPGIREYELLFVRLIEKITNGSKITINETGTQVVFAPGFITGGSFDFDCGLDRGIGYYIEGILPLLIFSKIVSTITFHGITNNNVDMSVDMFRSVTIELLKQFGIVEGLQLIITKRSCPPLGGGEVKLICPNIRKLIPIELLSEGFVKRIRGICYSTRVTPQINNRVIDKCRRVFNNFIPDVYIYSDHSKGSAAGLSSGYGIVLIAETTEKVLYGTEYHVEEDMTPEDLGIYTANLLCEEINKRGCVDTTHQSLCLLLMILSTDSVSKIRIGKLSKYTIQYIRHLKDFFGVTFKIVEDFDTNTLIFSCIGTGYVNISRKVN